jgi:hypothetical protein
MSTSRIPQRRPKTASLETRSSNLHFSSNGKNKSVWQSFVDDSGFAKRHPKIMNKRSNAKSK